MEVGLLNPTSMFLSRERLPCESSEKYEKTTTAGKEVTAFLPFLLPPVSPAIALEGELLDRLCQARNFLARLTVVGERIPSVDLFLYAFVR